MLSKFFSHKQEKNTKATWQEEQEQEAAKIRRQQEAAEKKRQQQQEQAKRDAEQAAKVKNATDAARSLISRSNGNGVMVFREMYDLPLLTAADKNSGPWKNKGLALDGNQDGSYFIVENSKGELRRATPAFPWF